MAYIANGSDPVGFRLEADCAACVLGRAACPVMAAQLTHNYDQHKNAPLAACLSLLVDKMGNCLMKPLLDAQNNLTRMMELTEANAFLSERGMRLEAQLECASETIRQLTPDPFEGRRR